MVKPYTGTDQAFLSAWSKAVAGKTLPPTRRQYRKWLQQRGKAWNARNEK